MRSRRRVGLSFSHPPGVSDSSCFIEGRPACTGACVEYSPLGGMLGSPVSVRAERALERRSDAILELLHLGHLRDRPVQGLPYGVLKRVEIATALATDPDLLMLDEPGSGMGPDEADALGDELLDLRKEFDLSIIMIEHHVPLVVRVCDYVYCLNFGQLLTEGAPDAVRKHPEVVAAYLGEEAPEAEAEAEAIESGLEGAEL